MEKIVILGSTGNIGQVVLKNLQDKNVEVFAGVRNEKDFEKVSKYDATPVVVDFTNLDSLNQTLEGKNRVFLVTPLIQNPEKITQNVISSSKLNNIKHFVRSTAAGANSKGQIQMARWAGMSEDLIKDSDVNFTIIRPHNFLQNFINYHSHSIKQNNSFYIPNGKAKVSLLDINDMGEAVSKILTSEKYFGKTYELSGLAYTNNEIADILSKILGRNIAYIDVSEKDAKESLLSMNMPEWMVNAMMELNYIIKQGWSENYTEDFKNITGKEYTSAETFFEANKGLF